MPAQDGLRLDEQDRVTPCRHEAGQQDEHRSIQPSQPGPGDLATGDLELLAQEGVLANQVFRRTELVEEIAQDWPGRMPSPASDSIAERAEILGET